MTPVLASILSTLLTNNLPKVAQAVVDKGLDYVQEKTGVELKPDMTPQEVAALRDAAQRHEEFRIEQDNRNTADARDLQKEALRKAAYQAEADPLFFKYQRGEATREEWLAKVDEIRARYP